MINVLLILVAVVLFVALALRVIEAVKERTAWGKKIDALMDDERLSEETRAAGREVALYREARRTIKRGDPGYEELRVRARPHLSRDQVHELRGVRNRLKRFYLDHTTPGIYQYIIIFIVCSVAGLVIEMVFMAITSGRTESRVGLVWGPFSPLYGFGAVFLTAILWNFRKAPWYHVFFVSALMGGTLEQATGMGMEYFAHAQSWTYIGLPDCITQWVAWRFLVMWGVLGLVWCRLIMPEVIYRIGEPTSNMQVVVVSVLTVYLMLDIAATMYCFYRKGQRDANIAPATAIDAYVDDHFSDEFISNRFQNLVVGEQLEPNAPVS